MKRWPINLKLARIVLL